MSLSLKLQLKKDNKVLVTNSENLQQKEVTLAYLQKILRDQGNRMAFGINCT